MTDTASAPDLLYGVDDIAEHLGVSSAPLTTWLSAEGFRSSKLVARFAPVALRLIRLFGLSKSRAS